MVPAPVRSCGLRSSVNSRCSDTAAWAAEHGPVVLVGASLGGTTITGVANTVPDLVDRLVYISAWSCVQRSNPVEYMREPEFGANLLAPLAALNVGDPAALGVGRANYRTADPTLLAALKAAVMTDGTDQQFRAFLNILQPDESLAVMMADSRGHADTWGTIARAYIRLTDDRSRALRRILLAAACRDFCTVTVFTTGSSSGIAQRSGGTTATRRARKA